MRRHDRHDVDRHVDRARDRRDLLRRQQAARVDAVGEHHDRAACGSPGRRVGDACAPSARSRRTATSGRRASTRASALSSAPASVGERLQRLQVHVEAEHRRFVSFASVVTEPQRAEHVPRRLPRFFDQRRDPHAAADVEQQRHPHRRIVVGVKLDDVAPRAPFATTKSSFFRSRTKRPLLVADDRRDRDDVDRRLERRPAAPGRRRPARASPPAHPARAPRGCPSGADTTPPCSPVFQGTLPIA